MALVLGGIAFNKADRNANTSGLFGPTGPKGDVGPRGPQGERGPAGVSGNSSVLKSVASPDIPSPYLAWGDVETFQAGLGFTAATTTVCAIQSPPATSTLRIAAASFGVSSTTNSVVTIAKAASAFATTTRLAFGTISANAQGTIVAIATSTDATGNTSSTDPFFVFGPNQWLVVGMADGTPEAGAGTFSPTGRCSASWMMISQ